MTVDRLSPTVRSFGRYSGIGLYFASGPVVPVFLWLILLNLIWLVGFIVAWRASAARWWAALVAGPVAVLFWILCVADGDVLLGWTA